MPLYWPGVSNIYVIRIFRWKQFISEMAAHLSKCQQLSSITHLFDGDGWNGIWPLHITAPQHNMWHLYIWTVVLLISQPVSQSVSQLIHPLVSLSVNQSVSQSVHSSVCPPYSQSVKHKSNNTNITFLS